MAEVPMKRCGASVYPATETEMTNTISAEGMPTRYNCLGKMRNNACKIAIALVGIAISAFIVVLVINFVWKLGQLQEKDVHIQSMYIDLKVIDDHTVMLGGNATLPLSFKASGDVEPSMLGTFRLTTSTYKFRPIVSISTSTFQTSPTEQVIVVRFPPSKTYLTDYEMLMFRKLFDANKLWIKLKGDFKWRVKGTALYFRDTTAHASFRCAIPYEDLISNAFYSGDCIP